MVCHLSAYLADGPDIAAAQAGVVGTGSRRADNSKKVATKAEIHDGLRMQSLGFGGAAIECANTFQCARFLFVPWMLLPRQETPNDLVFRPILISRPVCHALAFPPANAIDVGRYATFQPQELRP